MRDELKYNILFLLTSIGLVSSFIIHLLVAIGVDMKYLESKSWLFTVVICLIVLSVLCLTLKWIGEKVNKKKIMKMFINKFPKWLIILIIMIFIYTILNLLYVEKVLREGGLPGVLNGEYVLQKNGVIIKNLSETEYLKHELYFLRSISGIWIYFYSFTWIFLYRVNALFKSNHCFS